jgi:hypothetical protein
VPTSASPRLPAIASLAIVVLSAPAASQTFLHVRAGAAGGDGSCAQPFGSMSEALAGARTSPAPVTIRLAAGTYREARLLLDTSNVGIEGGYDPGSLAAACTDATVAARRDVLAFASVLDGDVDSNGVGDERILDIGPGLSDVTLDALTFTHGRAGASAPGPLPPRDLGGGAIRVRNCERVVIRRCTFTDNETTGHQAAGGAIYALAAPAGAAIGTLSLEIADNIFERNRSGNGIDTSGNGGAVGAWDVNLASHAATVNAHGNTFRGNEAHASGELDAATWCTGYDGTQAPQPNLDCAPRDGTFETCASRGLGGAVVLWEVGGTWADNLFENNSTAAFRSQAVDATGLGGAIASLSSVPVVLSSQPVISQNVFTANTALAGPGSAAGCGAFGGGGGAAYLSNFGSHLQGNQFIRNVADASTIVNAAPQVADGGAVSLIAAGSPNVDGNAFDANQAHAGRGAGYAGSGGGLFVIDGAAPASPVITNNIFSGNVVDSLAGGGAYGGGLTISSVSAAPLVAGNLFEGNFANGVAGQASGIGGGALFQLAGGLVADNVVRDNHGNNLVGGGEFRVSGFGFFGARPGDPSAAPRIQNNLIAGNDGTGLGLAGFAADLNGDGVVSDPAEIFFCAPPLYQNTLTGNGGAGLATNESDGMLVDGDVLWNNDTRGTGTGEWVEAFLGGTSRGVTVHVSALGGWPPTLNATVTNAANSNILGIDPQFVDPSAGDYHLRQRPDQPTGATSPLIDAGWIDASLRDYGPTLFDMSGTGVLTPYDRDSIAGADTMAARTTRTPSGAADAGRADIGWHDDVSSLPGDSDGDGLIDVDETAVGLDPFDADSDDDGLRDGDEPILDTDADGLIDPLDCDADGDRLPDGLESGLVAPDADTDVTASCAGTGGRAFVADTDALTTTDPRTADSDGDSCLDGAEDADHDGAVDAGESDPRVAGDCPPPTRLRVNDALTALSGGPAAPCGPRTLPSLSEQLDAAATCEPADWSGGCPTPHVDATRTLPWAGVPISLANEAAPGGAPLVIYEIEGCPGSLRAHRAARDVVIEIR